MIIQAVFFDMGGTIETFSYTKDLRLEKTPGIQSLLISAGINLGLNNQQLFKIVASGLKEYHNWSLTSLTELKSEKVWRNYVFKNFSIDKQALASISEDLMFFIETQFYYREMRKEIPEVLEQLKIRGFKIGLISNVNSIGQVPFNLEKYNIKQYFNPIILSSEYGRRKPDPAIFHYAARLANVPTSECIYVGDRISRDIYGAKRAGFELAVQIFHNFDSGEDESGPEPDMKIDNMIELLDIIKRENTRSLISKGSDIIKNRKVKAILFDAGDILYFRQDKSCKFNQFLDELGYNKDAVKGEMGKLLKDKAFQGEINRSQYQEALLQLYGISDPELIKRGKNILEFEDNNVTFFDDVRETLLQLKAEGFYLGIITDTAASTHMKMKWFESGGFGHVWDVFISSKEIGLQKPHPEIYLAALKQLSISADQAVFVGHDADELIGAKAVGMKTVAFNYKDDAEADCYIEHFADLLQLIELRKISN